MKHWRMGFVYFSASYCRDGLLITGFIGSLAVIEKLLPPETTIEDAAEASRELCLVLAGQWARAMMLQEITIRD